MTESSAGELSVYLEGIGVRGPGLVDWPQAEAILSGRQAHQMSETLLPAPESLPPTERRRSGRVVRLAFAIGLEAARQADANPAQLPMVFASSGGDGDNCHEICQTLASAHRALSPTRFHNSVHNAPAGYWSIAASTQVQSTTVCAYDASFSAGLLEATAQVAASRSAVALLAYDLDYPQPLRAVRKLSAAFGIAFVLQATASPRSIATLKVRIGTGVADRLDDKDLEAMRETIPAAEGLLLLQAVARRRAHTVNVAYLGEQVLRVKVEPCA